MAPLEAVLTTERAGTRSDDRKQGRNSAGRCSEDRALPVTSISHAVGQNTLVKVLYRCVAQVCWYVGETGEKWAIIRKSTLKNREK